MLFRTLSLPASCIVFSALSSALAADGLAISVTLDGIDRNSQRDDLLTLSRLYTAEGEYGSVAPIRRAADQDAVTLQQALVSQGYYAALVSVDVVREGLDVSVAFRAERGDAFAITGHRIDFDEAGPEDRPSTLEQMSISAGDDPSGDNLKRINDEILAFLRDNGYPEALALSRRVDARLEDGTAEAVYTIHSGPAAVFGQIDVFGAERTQQRYIENLRPFEIGEPFRQTSIDTYRAALGDTGLFREISIQPGPPDENGQSSVQVTVEERPPRTFGVGASFGTDVGVGATAYWENRNFRGTGDTLEARLTYSLPRQQASLVYAKPYPRLPGAWRSSILLENEDTDAFTAQSVTLTTGMNKYFLDRDLEVTADLQYQFSNIEDLDGTEETFSAVSLPVAAIFNNENDPLDPTEGHRARLVVTPFFGDRQFNRVEISGATRASFGPGDRLSVALRARFGATYGTTFDDLPATERFFAGGGGSVRGFAFQEAGPIDADTGNPTGGLSAAELNVEARYNVTDTIQVAAFADTGTVFPSDSPDFSEEPLVGVGVGVRYRTAVGPIRVDIATPLNRREILGPDPLDGSDPAVVFEDAPVQLYIALGQSF